ncbi:MAG: nucleotidyltransferase [Rugosibacter sp.]|jgi:hypothetical protein|nr:hypothetical protein [Rugosibacter sp.]
MPRRKPAPADTRHLRRAVAIAAARLMAEDGVADYATAKRKAARSLGADNGEGLPTNEEITNELRQYQAIYQEDEQIERLYHMRQTALTAMQLLHEFNPRLTGPVLDGTAARYSPIHLQLVADSSKDLEIWLLTNQIEFATASLHRHAPHGPEDRFLLEMDDTTIMADVFSSHRKNSSTPSAAMAEVKTLLANSATSVQQNAEAPGAP